MAGHTTSFQAPHLTKLFRINGQPIQHNQHHFYNFFRPESRPYKRKMRRGGQCHRGQQNRHQVQRDDKIPDGPRYHQDGRFYTGYAVVSSHEVIRAEPLSPHMSAQEAELKALTEACRATADPNVSADVHQLNPGDWVVIRRHVRRSLDPRFDGPFQVQLTTSTSVKLEGKPTWIHASHCKKVLSTAE
ncbi:uncharacterized protein [Dendrobates tinctorius]|uniref:uncharacterized protein isoform X2 n=1 Tax=Dendrobates tinctorius TaxID=92724 RepID=UPI003CCA3F64